MSAGVRRKRSCPEHNTPPNKGTEKKNKQNAEDEGLSNSKCQIYNVIIEENSDDQPGEDADILWRILSGMAPS